MTAVQIERLEDPPNTAATTQEALPVLAAKRSAHDPYLTWAGYTDFRYLDTGRHGAIRLAGRLREGHSLTQAMQSVNVGGQAALDARAILDTPYFTATMAHATDEACHALLRDAEFVLAEPGMRPIGLGDPQATLSTAAKTATTRRDESPDPLEQDIVIGVVDGLCGFANEAFCAGGRSRLDCYWDQEGVATLREPGGGTHWRLPVGAGYGRELDRSALNALVQRMLQAGASTSQRVELEKALYRELGHKTPSDADWSHGTHVLGTVLDELTDEIRPGLIYVQLPEPALRDTGARWAAANVLDAIDYIVRRAKKDAKVVINLSLGAFAGPHDGTSMVERAIDSIAAQSQGRITVVVAAGNAGNVTDDGTGSRKRCHAKVELDALGAPNASRTLRWEIDRPDSTESFMELWLPRFDGKDPGGLRVSLEHEQDPDMASTEVDPGATRPIAQAGSVVAAVINATGSAQVPNGQRGMVLIALGHTRALGQACAPTGCWLITLANENKAPVTVDAWIERRDVPGELRGYRPQYGFTPDTPHLTEEGSLATLANGKKSVVVGALALNRVAGQYEVADYSSRGPAETAAGSQTAQEPNRRGPDAYAVGQRTSRGFFSGTKKDLAGTSIAAAQVSAAIASALMASTTKPDATPLDALSSLAYQRLQVLGQPNAAGETIALAPDLYDRLVVLPKAGLSE